MGFLPVVLLVVLGVPGAWAVKRPGARAVFVALASYILLLLPMLGLLNIFYMRYALVSDHYQYHAVICVIAVVGGGVMGFFRHGAMAMRTAMRIVAALLVVGLMAESFSIAAVYRSAESVWLDTLAHNPRSWLAHAQLGEIDLAEAKGNPPAMEEAIGHLRAVTELRPEMAIGYANVGAAYVMAGEREAAREAFAKGLAAPVATRLERARIHQGLGSLAATAGDFAAAERKFREAAELDGESVSIHYALGATYAAEGKVGEARAELRRALELDPGNTGVREMLGRLEAGGVVGRWGVILPPPPPTACGGRGGGNVRIFCKISHPIPSLSQKHCAQPSARQVRSRNFLHPADKLYTVIVV